MEFKIYCIVYGLLVVSLLTFLVPAALREYKKEVKHFQDTGVALEREEKEGGVSTKFVNAVDVGMVAALVLCIGFVVWEKRDLETVEALPATEAFDAATLLGSLLGQLIIILVIVGLMFWRTKLVEQFGLLLNKYWKKLWWVAVVIGVTFGVIVLTQLSGFYDYVTNLNGDNTLQDSVLFLKESEDKTLIILLVIIACVGAPLSEEVLYRGYLYPVVKHYGGFWLGATFSGLLFSLVHFNLVGGPALFSLGFMLAFVYEKTRSLWTCVIAHCFFNSFTVINILS